MSFSIKKFNSFSGIDQDKFRALVKSGFFESGRILSSDYFKYCHPEFVCVALNGDNEHYAGVMVVEPIPLMSVHYLDKIVVAKEFQGNGLAKILWAELNKKVDKCIWRSKKENPFNKFYEEHCDGRLGFPESDYTFFYYGLAHFELERALVYTEQKKPTIIEDPQKK